MILTSLHDDSADTVTHAFTLDVDELDAGPVVIRLGGVVDRRTAEPLCQCVDEVLVSGRSLVLDLRAVDGVPEVLMPIVHATVLKVSRTRARVIVVGSAALAGRLEQRVPGVRCVTTTAEAFAAASGKIAPSTTVVEPRTTWIDTSEALQGRYL
ncbi:hypothetical protein GCM10007304_24040 [Rhodococcoides trifolii]|uniref:STAS domain-containing protein n=1 Tax=Rhodococcoides trifolii TaxID=908250 RepID=A0A917D596_9NOCA|nr:hypothetical protein [Rhodococcus trifolii]GGG09136.1 hypothetical protein GCM10007304_24040 [Rhodococcus trifolii]